MYIFFEDRHIIKKQTITFFVTHNYNPIFKANSNYAVRVQVLYSALQRNVRFKLGCLHMSRVDRAGPVTRTIFALGSYEKYQPGFRDEKRPKIQGTSSGTKFKKQSKHGAWRNTKILTFCPTIASLTLTAVSLQLNGMVMMWKIQQAMQDDAIRTARIPPVVHDHPVNRDEVFIWQNFPLTEISGTTEPVRPLIRTHRNFAKNLEVRWEIGNRTHMKRLSIIHY